MNLDNSKITIKTIKYYLAGGGNEINEMRKMPSK